MQEDHKSLLTKESVCWDLHGISILWELNHNPLKRGGFLYQCPCALQLTVPTFAVLPSQSAKLMKIIIWMTHQWWGYRAQIEIIQNTVNTVIYRLSFIHLFHISAKETDMKQKNILFKTRLWKTLMLLNVLLRLCKDLSGFRTRPFLFLHGGVPPLAPDPASISLSHETAMFAQAITSHRNCLRRSRPWPQNKRQNTPDVWLWATFSCRSAPCWAGLH